MFSYLKGKAIAIQRNVQNRAFLILEVGGIGYEIQIPGRIAQGIQLSQEELLQVFADTQCLAGTGGVAPPQVTGNTAETLETG